VSDDGQCFFRMTRFLIVNTQKGDITTSGLSQRTRIRSTRFAVYELTSQEKIKIYIITKISSLETGFMRTDTGMMVSTITFEIGR